MMRDDTSAEARLLRISETVTPHVEPHCRHFGECGGCQLQHLPAEEQLKSKTAMLLDLLRGSGLPQLPEVQTHAADPWQYRNRARMRVRMDGAKIGYSRRASNEFLPIVECPIVSPLVWRVATALQSLVRENVAALPSGTSAFEVFVNDDESAAQLSLHVDATVASVDRNAPRDLRIFCDALQHRVPQLAGAGLLVSSTPDRTQSKRVQESGRVEIARWGDPALDYNVDGRTYRITRNAFFQVNRFLTAAMVELVVGNRTGGVAYDLFAGAGLFSVALSERFERVLAVEIGEPAATDLAAHLKTRGPQHRAYRSTTLQFLQQQTRSGAAPPDLVVLDPPRAGLGPQVVRALLQCNPREIIYVSCNADTFARDARPLIESGYSFAELHLLDLFPQTFHTETIAVFQR